MREVWSFCAGGGGDQRLDDQWRANMIRRRTVMGFGNERERCEACKQKAAEIVRLTDELSECNRLREAENRINAELIARGRKHGIFKK